MTEKLEMDLQSIIPNITPYQMREMFKLTRCHYNRGLFFGLTIGLIFSSSLAIFLLIDAGLK